MHRKPQRSRRGFTLVEIMIGVTIIGLLSSMAVPTFQSVRRASNASALANNFRTYAAAFEIYLMENGVWPQDVNRGVVPPGMEGALPRFTEPTIVGGNWDWDYRVSGITAGVSLIGSNADQDLLRRFDRILDDGNLATGRFRLNGARAILILEE